MNPQSHIDPVTKLQQSAEKIHDATYNLIKYLFGIPEDKTQTTNPGKRKKTSKEASLSG